jgi:hypothetical protein
MTVYTREQVKEWLEGIAGGAIDLEAKNQDMATATLIFLQPGPLPSPEEPIDRKHFFDTVRAGLFGGRLTQQQVDGMNIILDYWERQSAWDDLRWLAYPLATTKWETAHTMWPIAEYGHGAGHEYGVPDPETGETYYGRGFVQLTWKDNYQKMQGILGIPLVRNPDLALNPVHAAPIMFEGMVRGTFTGVKLADYFNDTTDDAYNARRIVNGVDHADDIAGYHAVFMQALTPPE